MLRCTANSCSATIPSVHSPTAMPAKIPESVLVVIFDTAGSVLLIRRTDGLTPSGGAMWQSVTGSKDFPGEPWVATAQREVLEETGIDARAPGCELADWQLQNTYDIYPQWRHRYASGVTRNTERVFGLQVPVGTPVRLSPLEHVAAVWLPVQAAAEKCFSASNAAAVLRLLQRPEIRP